VYSLALGDPSSYEDFKAADFVVNAASESLLSNKGNGYTDSIGLVEARECLAREFSYDSIQLTPEDVIIDIGGTGAIHTILQIFLNPGDNILIPSPGFPLYKTMAMNLSAQALTYELDPKRGWEVNLESLERVVNDRSKLLVIVNPSNPCGSVYSREHLTEVLEWAERHKIVILSDEVYHGMTFTKPHFPLGSLTDSVPVFTVGALSKMFLVPGWRCGWTLIYDKQRKCDCLRANIRKIKNMLLHPPPFIMQAIPKIFANKPTNYFLEMMSKVKARAELIENQMNDIPCLSVSAPEGSLYTMVTINFDTLDIKDSVCFAARLALEEGVILLPAEAFLSHSGFRVVLCHPLEILSECMNRLKTFVKSHTISS
jgi:tyrosine aminotransferase